MYGMSGSEWKSVCVYKKISLVHSMKIIIYDSSFVSRLLAASVSAAAAATAHCFDLIHKE